VVQFAESEPASRSEQDLSSASEFNEVLLAMAAHDLRQPLQVILSAFAWLERHHPGERERRYVEVGQLAARRLREQLDHLANAVRLHQRRRGALLSPVKLAPLLDALHRENADLARERGPEDSHLSNPHSHYERRNPPAEHLVQSRPERDQIYAQGR
jgi:two-component system, OmpR family, phosphate regulon sensor histidine kinase PhoR